MSAPGDCFRDDHTRVRKLERLRAQLAGLVERQLRAEAEAQALERRYTEQFGALELRRLRAQLSLETARSRRALIAARDTSASAPELAPDLVETAAIEAEVARLNQRTQRRCAALRATLDTAAQIPTLPPADPELSAALRRVLRCLHPDVRGEAGEAFEQRWPDVVVDYRAGRTEALRKRADRLEAAMPAMRSPSAAVFEAEEARLRRAVETYRQRLQGMQARRPLRLRECLADPEWIARERATLVRRAESDERLAAAQGAPAPVDAGEGPVPGERSLRRAAPSFSATMRSPRVPGAARVSALPCQPAR